MRLDNSIRSCRLWLLAIIVIALAAASAAANQARAKEGAEPILPGALTNPEGYQAVLDMPSYKATILAIEEANGAGGLREQPVHPIEERPRREFSR